LKSLWTGKQVRSAARTAPHRGHNSNEDAFAINGRPSKNDVGKHSSDQDHFTHLIARLTALQSDASESWRQISHRLTRIEPANIESARNLIHYLSIRRHDIREIQGQLANSGISSLGRSESHVMRNLDTVVRLLHKILNRPYVPSEDYDNSLSFADASDILSRRTKRLLGRDPKQRKVRIMVTLPTEAADDYDLVKNLIAGGMDCARINCAHDTPEVWERMVNNIRKARKATGRDSSICFDLAGPKLRTGALEPGPQVLKWRPSRDVFGRVTAAARIWLTSREHPTPPPGDIPFQISLPDDFVKRLSPSDQIRFTDARAASRSALVSRVLAGGVVLETNKTCYVVPETEFEIGRAAVGGEEPLRVAVGPLPPLEQAILLHAGDELILTRSQAPGKPAKTAANGKMIEPPRIPCTLPEVFDRVSVGEKVWFDDGKLGGHVTHADHDEIRVEITRAGPQGHKLRADKGINLPDSKLDLPALTPVDLQNLKFVVGHADLVGYSFVRSGNDVRLLHEQLKKMNGSRLGIILKIETRAAFENLPELLLASMEHPVSGVMIARGDLAVESGFERLAEMQEEILWMCEAAHVPVVWATQVLEQLSKKGVYSRAEITDAAMSERAECVMLNKGPYVLEAVRTLDDILTRMQAHQDKKRSMMRPLKLAKRFFEKQELKAAHRS
jgi:pyruvate kinase